MAEENVNSRLEAFSDGVFGIALTLLIIDIKLPPSEIINSTPEFWAALKNIAPSFSVFILSFTIILITWVNHHNALKLINKSSASLFYANGFLLLTVVVMPFPTSLMGDYILTDHAAPAVVLYDSVIILQSIGWILLSSASHKNNLSKNEKANLQIIKNGKYGYFSFIFYSLCTVAAFWFPFAIAIITVIVWIFWLIYGIRIKHE